VNRLKACFLCGVPALLLLLAMIGLPASASARPYLAVDLIKFELESVASGVEIHWETGTEMDVAFFKVKRGPAPDGPFTDLPAIGLIEARGSTFAGASYTVVDETALSGETYRYQLYELTLSNVENLVAAATITLGPTATPEIIGGGDEGATSTPAPTSTRAGDSTPTPATTAASGGSTPAVTATAVVTAATVTGEPEVTATTAAVARTLGPTPTRFSFTPVAPVTSSNASQSNPPLVEAASTEAVAQVTSDPYPVPPGDVTISTLDAPGAGTLTEMTQTLTYPWPAGTAGGAPPGALPESVGRGQGSSGGDLESGIVEAGVAETSSAARILLWFGFLTALFIFIGGIAVSIALSTRRRQDEPF
jgi:hypothetical protein